MKERLSAIGQPSLFLVLGTAVLFGSFCAVYLGILPSPSFSIEWKTSDADSVQYSPRYSSDGGYELAFIYIGSARCGACNVEWLPEVVKRSKVLIQEQAFEREQSFVAIGVGADWVATEGVDHLMKFGVFDELISGRKWLNSAALKYVWQEFPGVAATPQVVVVERFVEGKKTSERGYGLRDEKLVIRKVGTDEIKQWFEFGAPIPTNQAMHMDED